MQDNIDKSGLTVRPKVGINRPATEPVNALAFDWQDYDDLLDRADLTEDERRELLETLWSIVVAFVDLGFGLHPVQQVIAGLFDEPKIVADESAALLHSSHSVSNNDFSKAARRPDGQGAETIKP